MVFEQLQQMAQAVEQSWCAAWASLAAVPSLLATIVDDTPEFLRVYTPGIDETLLNLVMRYTAPGPVASADIERVFAPFRLHHLLPQWWLLLGTEPAGLREALRALGMRNWGGSTAMACSLLEAEPSYPPPARTLELGRVSTAKEGLDALAVICDVFYIPPAPMRRWSLDNPTFGVYFARWQGRVVAALATMVTGEAVGVYHVATLTGARRRGIAGNLVLYALREARAAGCTLATLTATPEARHLYEQLGFRACGVIEQWMPGYRLTAELTGQATGFGMWK
jgi:GNAT superfamily N-acetyltransferase